MTDSTAVKEAEASMANLLLDEVTGEKVSKTELKKRQKQREKEARKKEKDAAAPPKPEKKVSAEEEEANLTPNVRSDLYAEIKRVLINCSNTSKSEASESTNSANPSSRTPTPTSSMSPMIYGTS